MRDTYIYINLKLNIKFHKDLFTVAKLYMVLSEKVYGVTNELIVFPGST